MDLLFAGPVPPLRRDLEIAQTEHEGRPMLLVSDLFGLREESFMVPPALLMMASLFDGRRKIPEIRAELAKHKVILAETEVQAAVEQLRKAGLLETEETAAQRKKAFDDFRASGRRAMDPRKRGLPADPLEFGSLLGGYYAAPGGPGDPKTAAAPPPAPLGLVSPHIDFFRGGPHYAWAYRELAQRRPPDVVVALGVAHLSPDSPWIMTRKSYETPLGPVAVDEALYDKVRGALWYDPLDDEWAHAKEHSLEFQADWLRYVWRSETPKWLPILCSSYERFCGDRAPSSIPTVEDAIRKIGGLLAAEAAAGRRVLVLAGIDLAHVGRRFGDDMDVTPELEKKIEALDRASLEHALSLRADEFFLAGTGENAWRKICGLSALYTALRFIGALGGRSGRLLSYGQAPDPAGGVVSFTSAVFE